MGTPRLCVPRHLTSFLTSASPCARVCASCACCVATQEGHQSLAGVLPYCFSGDLAAQNPSCASLYTRRRFAASAAGGAAGSDDSSTSTSAAAMLDDLVNGINYERSGIPAAAGTSASSRFDLGRMHRLLEALGSPHLALKAVHVAGSKGKGSTVSMLASCFAAAGYRAGVYTSPHLLALEERIAVAMPGGAGGRRPRPIPADDLAFLLRRHADAIRARVAAEGPGGPGALSHFELTTALALRYFADCGVDVAVVETGLGGVTDATNVFPPPNLQAAVITGLGLEHVEALGGSLRSIATAKAGIARSGRPLVLGPQPYPEAAEVVRAEAARLGAAPVVRAEQSVRVHSHGMLLDPSAPGRQAVRERLTLELLPEPSSSSSNSGSSNSSCSSGISGRTLEVTVGLVGPHQAANVATAVAAVRVLRGAAGGGWALPDEALAEGLAAAYLPGRFQVLKLPGAAGPYVVLDGAHTADSAAALVASLQAAFPLQPQPGPSPPAAGSSGNTSISGSTSTSASSSTSSSTSSSSSSSSSITPSSSGGGSSCPVALVLAMADDKDHRAVVAALRGLAPKVAVFTSVPIAGSFRRAAAPGTLAGHWQAAAILAPPGSRPFRCRELVQASLGAAFAKAAAELRAWRVQLQGGGAGSDGAGGAGGGGGEVAAPHPGVIVVTGSLHAVAEAHKLPELAPLLMGW